MEHKDSDLEMEVDSAGAFSHDEGEMQCGEESHQVQKGHHQSVNDDSRGRNKIGNGCQDEDLSNSFMKLSVKDDPSVSPADFDNDRRISSGADGNHSKFTNHACNSSPQLEKSRIKLNDKKNLMSLQGEPYDVTTRNFETRSSVIDGEVNVRLNDTNKVSLPYYSTTVDIKEQKQAVIKNTIERPGAKSDDSNTVRKDIGTDGELQKHEIIELLPITSAKDGSIKVERGEKTVEGPIHGAMSDKIILSLVLSTNSKAEGFYNNDHPTDLSFQLKLANDIRNSYRLSSSSALKELEYGINNWQDDLTSAQKEVGHGVSSLQSNTSSALTEKLDVGNNIRNSLNSYTTSAQAETVHSIKSLQSSKSLVLRENVKSVNSLHYHSVPIWKERGYDVNSLHRETCSALEKKDQGVKSLKKDSSSTLKEKEHGLGSVYTDSFSTQKEKGHHWGSLSTSLSPTLKGRGQGVNNLYSNLSSMVKENGHGVDSVYAASSSTLKERKLHRDSMKFETNEIIVDELQKNSIKHEQPHHCEHKYPHTDENKILQKLKNGKADVGGVQKTDFFNINRPLEDENCLKGFNGSNACEHRCNHRKSYPTIEERVHNSSLDCNLEKQSGQSHGKIRNQMKSKLENESEIRMSHSNNGLDKRHEIKTKDRENYRQRRQIIHVGKTQPSGCDSCDNDTDEWLHKEDSKYKFAGIQNPNIVYTKLSWESYLKINRRVGEWDCDCLDPFEQSLTRCSFGGQKKKVFYRDLDAHAHHDSGEIRGWDKGEFVFIGELWTGTNERVEVNPESSKEEGELTPAGGAIRKTHEKNTDVKRGEQRNLQRSKSDAERNTEYGSSKESSKRIIYGLTPDQFTEDETDSSDELKDEFRDIKTGLQLGSQYQGCRAVLTRESLEITDGTKPGDSCGVPSSSLVQYLTLCKSFSSDMTKILSKFSLFENVRKFFEEHPDVFSISGNIVELRPKISLCEGFLSSYGCQDKLSCTKLHICDGFIVNICYDSNCIYGHNICTTHNRKVLQSFFMENLDASTIIDVLRLSMLGAANFQSLDICYDYNFSSCGNYNCKALHICLDYVGGLGVCVRPECKLNHDIQTLNCLKVLSSYGIDITALGEEEKLLEVIHESYKITQLVQGYEPGGQINKHDQLWNQQRQSSTDSKVCPKQEHRLDGAKLSEPLSTSRNLLKPSETIGNYDVSEHSKPAHTAMNPPVLVTPSEGCLINGKSRTYTKGENDTKSNFMIEFPSLVKSTFADFFPTKDKVNIKNQKTGTKVATVWSKYAIGDVEIPEICYYSLNTVCKFESSGCQRLHAPMEFHWQMKVSTNVSWINLQPHQVFHLELCYMDPSKEISKLPAPLLGEHPEIVHQILKDEKYHVNFTKLQLINGTTFEIYELRRLHVQVKDKNYSVNEFLWYFKDVAGKWILYGNVDSSGDPHSAAKIRSHDIEKKYLNKEGRFYFKNCSGKKSYILDFKKMEQVNRNTGSVREVRRRPKPHLSPEP